MRAWKKYPVFSTFIAMLVMIVIQVYARGFAFKTYGQWASAWLINMLNVLRSNSSVGMIALGMTFVIITGGIDLAVGSNIAGVATVVMVLLDVSSKGRLTAAGVTGVPNYVIAILAGLAAGSLIGLLTGLGITKGRVPPFIITLGIMNIVRSLAQYFTKSYKAEVPREFQVIANYEFKALGGQMLLPIIYWLLLAALMYVISRHTAFGRHIYAVGSNERASRLSGINVDRVKTGVYTLMGVIVAIAAVTSVARLRGVDVASAGSGFEMDAIAAVVVGGTSMAGGRGSIIGTVFGVLIIGIMNNLLVLMHVDSFLANAFTGIIIIFAVLIQRKES
ncbi:MAG: ABC transporter permease [Clostridia bacterium]|nr:ABC transporter permease [Clostridia bacterium]